jgi:predicted  nucleic acid-binding Zn-ribbon protein
MHLHFLYEKFDANTHHFNAAASLFLAFASFLDIIFLAAGLPHVYMDVSSYLINTATILAASLFFYHIKNKRGMSDAASELNGIKTQLSLLVHSMGRFHIAQEGRDTAQESRDAAQEARDAAQESRDKAQEARDVAQEARDVAQEARDVADERRHREMMDVLKMLLAK